MKKIILILMFSISVQTQAQVQNIINWKTAAVKSPDGTYQIILIATLKEGWHIYSQNPGEGPFPTRVTFSKSPVLALKGGVIESGKLKIKNSDVFNSKVRYYSEKLELNQKVEMKANVKTEINGVIEFMVCNNEQCLTPQKVKFSVSLPHT